MAFIELYRDKLKKNYNYLDQLFKTNNIEWAVVSKLLCGNELYLKELLKLNIKEICDARVSNLVKIKKLAPEIDTVYIKPPAKRSIKKIVKYADASFNTEFETIKWLSEEAVKQSKIHKIIIMIELGDLREGVMGEDLMDFYGSIFKLPNIKVTGIGTNLNCLHGVYPSEDKMVQLSLYKQLIESKFNRKIPWVTGGTSVVIPLLLMKQLPAGINHFRVGEALFFGNNLITGETFKGMETDVFKLFAEVIEITEKPINPIGNMGENPSGEEFEVNPEDYGKTHHRAIIDLGVLDVANSDLIIPEDKNITIVGASSDMLVLDIEKSDKDYHIGDLISFRLKYMGALRLFNSEYITKKIV
ncbi:MAG: alanine/ornithine racemase family PLP-dependent enzyme [Flavobacteriales bacterium]|nr:alanine/ornithine racemase family PLP-dependent enzyme [Flavobacteriales bacterium]MCW8912805.1 alanine/ornithine racemase family PLP-dependent enzyme [Flavobacteriales bacterium]MCW8938809.1 alanine/ornithine racemase family PLP-dependent enzyme [Flavobacteriales bacterium]MCW8968519.1 alanine/ornithine racemase family PLP-dependent enzyme [Flavobacteriales bacterium]MCW8989463.1 alanine/ornithine racemase family PLP-dependent enzyme [Flavobacteriales bacterium]